MEEFPEKVDYLKNKIIACIQEAREYGFGVITAL